MSFCTACSGNGHHLCRSAATKGVWKEFPCTVCKGTGKTPLKKRIVKKAKNRC